MLRSVIFNNLAEEKKFWKRDEIQWFVLRVKWVPLERLEERLRTEGVETFVPRRVVLKTDARGRKHRVLKNVLPELVFARQTYDFLHTFVKTTQLKTGLAVSFCKQREGNQNHVMVVPEWQMEPFIKAVTQISERVTYLQPDELELQRGDKVRIHGGPLDGMTGEVMRLKGKRKKQVVLRLMEIAAISLSFVEPEYIEKVNE